MQLREIEILKQLNFIFEDERINTNDYTKKVKDFLVSMKLYTPKVERHLAKIAEVAQREVVDFDLFLRGLKKTLLKKGDKKKNVGIYIKKVSDSLDTRESGIFGIEINSDDIFGDEDDVSIVPKKVFKKELYGLQVELIKLENWLDKTGKTVIIIFEGRDAAGKGSTIKKFTENINPKFFNVIALGIPTPDERKNWWERYKSQIKPGMINLFDRSWYNRGLIEPVMGYGTPEEYEDFMNNVEDFENSLVENGDYLFKFWFSIDKDTQAKRFKQRLMSPLKQWKYSPNDSKMQDLWDRFTEFKEKLFDKTSTLNHPWVIFDALDKRLSGLNAIRYVLQQIPYEGKNEELLNKEFPEAITVLRPDVDESVSIIKKLTEVFKRN